jgi:hypothetical protein
MSWILTYLMVGIVFIALYDYICIKLETELRFNNRERVVVALLWPIGLMMFIWSFVQVFFNKSE